MPPPTLGRYQGALQGMTQFGNPSQQQHQQQHLQHHAQNVGAPSLTPHSIANHQHFGNPNSNLNLFGPPGGNNAGNYGGGFGGVGAGGTGLGSHAAQMGFAHGAALQRQEANDGLGPGQPDWKGMGKNRIRDVWRGNLAQEMAVLRNVVEKYPYISMVGSVLLCPISSLTIIIQSQFHVEEVSTETNREKLELCGECVVY